MERHYLKFKVQSFIITDNDYNYKLIIINFFLSMSQLCWVKVDLDPILTLVSGLLVCSWRCRVCSLFIPNWGRDEVSEDTVGLVGWVRGWRRIWLVTYLSFAEVT